VWSTEVKPILNAEVLGIGRNRAHCLRGSLEQEIVDDGLILVGKRDLIAHGS
jgi:hypothetical protein